MEEPPHQYHRRNDEHAEDLVAAKGTPLKFASLVFGDLLIVRLDAAFNHECAAWMTTEQYRWVLTVSGQRWQCLT